MLWELLIGDYHVRRKLAYIFNYDYIESDAPSEKQKRLRHLMLRQIKESNITLKKTKIINNINNYNYKYIVNHMRKNNYIILPQVFDKSYHVSIDNDTDAELLSDTSDDEIDIAEFN